MFEVGEGEMKVDPIHNEEEREEMRRVAVTKLLAQSMYTTAKIVLLELVKK